MISNERAITEQKVIYHLIHASSFLNLRRDVILGSPFAFMDLKLPNLQAVPKLDLMCPFGWQCS